MNIHLTRTYRLTQCACLGIAAALLLQGAAWSQLEGRAERESSPPADAPDRQRASASDAADRGDETADARDAEDFRGPSSGRETNRDGARRDAREDEAPLEGDEGRDDPGRFRDRRDDDRFDRNRALDRGEFNEPGEDADDSRNRRRPSERRMNGSAGRSSRGEFRVEDLRAPDLGLWFSGRTRDGLVISEVARSGAIAQFGFREGDQIVSVNGQRVIGEREFLSALFADDIVYERVPVVVLRGGLRRLIYVRPEVFVSQEVVADPLDRFGIVLDDRYIDRIVVWRVLPRSPAYYAGIRAGDVITGFDGRRVADAGDLVRLIEIADPANVLVQVSRNQQPRELYVDLAIVEPVIAPRTSLRTNVEQPMRMDRTFDDIQSVDPSSDRRLSPRPDVPPGIRLPGGEVGRDRGPIAPSGAEGGTPTTPMRLGFPR